MTIDLIKPHELFQLWILISAEPWLHFDDDGPKTYEDWTKHLADSEIMIFSARMGQKWIGAVGFQESTEMLRGIHFIKEVRGGVLPKIAVTSVLAVLSPIKIKARYFADNERVAKFLVKLGFSYVGPVGTTKRGGVDVQLNEVIFDPLREKLEL